VTTTKNFCAVAVIPAHLASVRFPRKILFEFHGLPMIEHVRRRALMSPSLDRVIVATCDEEIASAIRGFGGEVIMTANTHRNGTTRVAEAVKNVDCSHVVLLQGDEPLLLPRHIDSLVGAMRAEPDNVAWNATGPIENAEELDRHSFVKCAISPAGRIMYCFRRSPCFSDYESQRRFIRKILGIIAYRKDFLQEITAALATPIEQSEFIEQMRIIENGYPLKSLPVEPSLPSVNEPHEAEIVWDYVRNDPEQQGLLDRVLSGEPPR
jgi:3-deoxy-manno-octulosonate cytidylyltransferase (CMP-KDO synthetase)